jgi:hypothetical protein
VPLARPLPNRCHTHRAGRRGIGPINEKTRP